MAIGQTGAIYKSLNFDGKSSREYGVYITGAAVYNAPERAVEMISIPGRNGAFALDQGRFENITVTYPAGIYADNETDFADAISDFRNYLCSRSGYCRLTDEYNPDEYRLAVYKSGLEVEPALLRAGEFNITFECKPQRFLTSGETAVAVANNGTITNPTLFPSNPMLEVKGYGNIKFNGHSIDIYNETLGNVLLDVGRYREPLRLNDADNIMIKELNDAYYNNGDIMSMYRKYYANTWGAGLVKTYFIFDESLYIKSTSTEVKTNTAYANGSLIAYIDGIRTYAIEVVMPNVTFTAGTASTVTSSIAVTFDLINQGDNSVAETVTFTLTLTFSYDGNKTVTLSTTRTITGDTLNLITLLEYGKMQRADIYVDSSVSALGNPTYIDCDLGNAFMIKDNEYVSLNDNVNLGADLPELAPGSNTVTFDNTVTELKIVPKWWKV